MDGKINLIVSQELKDEATKKAQSMGLSLSAYVRLLLTQDAKK